MGAVAPRIEAGRQAPDQVAVADMSERIFDAMGAVDQRNISAVIEIVAEIIALVTRVKAQVAIMGEEQWASFLRAYPLPIAVVGIAVGVAGGTCPAVVITRGRYRMRR